MGFQVRAICLAWDSQRAIVGCEDTRALIFDMCSGKVIRSMPPNPGAVTAVYVMEKDDYLITAGGNKLTFYSFRNEDSIVNFYPKKKEKRKNRKQLVSSNRLNLNSNNSPICCFDISRDSSMAAVATHRTVQIWQLSAPELARTFDGHAAVITCIAFAPNGEFIASGSEDKTILVYGLQFGLLTTTFKGHTAPIHCLMFMMDSRRIVSADKDGVSHVWLSDSGIILQSIQGPYKSLAITNNMKFAVKKFSLQPFLNLKKISIQVCTNGDTTLRIWSLTKEDEKYTVSHSDEITCFVITADSLYVITGSKDMSLKVNI